jgi:hypothetical protein
MNKKNESKAKAISMNEKWITQLKRGSGLFRIVEMCAGEWVYGGSQEQGEIPLYVQTKHK